MRFRPPERLEKWIAYDGALGAELLVAEPEAEAADDITVGLGDDEGFSVGGSDAEIVISLPADADAHDLFPYLDSDSDLFDIDGNIHEDNVYIEISDPDGGEFRFFLLEDGVDELTPGDDAFNYIDGLDGRVGGLISGIGSNDSIMFMFEENGTYVLREFKLEGNNKLVLVENGAEVQVDLPTEDHGLRFHVTRGSAQLSGEQLLEQVFRSLVFKPDTPGDPPPNTPITGFDITIYYNKAGEGTPDGTGLFHDGPGGVFDPGNEGVIADSTDDAFEHVSRGNYNGGDDDGGDNGGDEIIPPVIPPDPGGEDGGGEDGGDDGGDDSGGDDSGNDPGGDNGDSGGDAGQGDDMGYIFQDDDDGATDDEGADDSEAEAREDAAPTVEQRAGEDGGAPESAADARQLELARDMEFMLTAVRNEREVLLGLIGRLQSEYLLREPNEFGELRGYLRRLFDLGAREQETVNRILDAMNREMEVFRSTAPGRRDGMLAESVRELIDSAERHSGEMGAYSQAIEAVADLLAARREAGLPPPTEAEAESLFAAKYGEAMSSWLADAGRIDPMGRDLTAAQRVAGTMPGE